MKKYRITFSGGAMTDIHKTYDVTAKNADEAFKIAYGMPESDCRRYTEIGVEEIPEGIANIGIRFAYYDEGLKKTSYNYMIIKAKNESHAKEYYNATYKGKKFYQPWPHKINAKGNCVYGKVVETYFAACPGYDADATS